MKNKPWVLILGANSGMAIACAHRYAKSNYNLYLASREVRSCEENAQDIRLRYQVKVQSVFFDAQNFSEHAEFYNNLIEKPKGVVLAFGVMYEQKDSQSNFNICKSMISTNYSGAVSILEIVSADFERRKSGFIVGISSVAGDRGRMSNYIYGSTKAALTTYLAGLRHRLTKSNIIVLTVKPGFVATKMIKGLDLPSGLIAQPDYVADLIYKSVKKQKSILYVKPIWRLIMMLIVHTPNFIFNKTRL
jgi:decaprenylphospho-beta-D-erythro-pentofuranosid-2-ulose 2-reductase